MKKLVLVLFLWLLTFGAIGLIQGSLGEQVSRDVAVTQVQDSEIPYHATRNLKLAKLGLCVLVALPALGTTTLVLRKG